MAEQPFMSGQPFDGDQPRGGDAGVRTASGRSELWDAAPPAWERDLDALVRPAFFVAPPPDTQQAILAAVLRAATEAPSLAPRPQAVPADTTLPSVPLVAYLLLAAVLVAYAAMFSWLQGLVGGADWLPTLAAQIMSASATILGPIPVHEPLTLTWLVIQRAPWLALLPLAWLLWERDRASSAPAA